MDRRSQKNDKPACCCPTVVDIIPVVSLPTGAWIDGSVTTPVGNIPRVTTRLTWRDHLGSWRVRWGFRRMRYRVTPGLYAVGSPTPQSPVFVSANFKMSFDRLRSHLSGRHGWILVLDTKGVNVWCAAGKGTFGTDELVNRIGITQLDKIVSHRRLILPQLSATGVCAREVNRRSGFRAIFGPILARDIPAFLDADMKATPEMRRVRFGLRDRAVLAPMEITAAAIHALPIAAVMLFLAGLGSDGYDLSRIASFGVWSAILILGAWLFGAVLTPIFLPWLPGRAFAGKGAWLGVLALIVGGLVLSGRPGVFRSWPSASAWIFLIPAVVSFVAMNFTGASTYTSLSGVKKEMRIAVPLQIAFAVVGLGLWIVGLFVR